MSVLDINNSSIGNSLHIMDFLCETINNFDCLNILTNFNCGFKTEGLTLLNSQRLIVSFHLNKDKCTLQNNNITLVQLQLLISFQCLDLN